MKNLLIRQLLRFIFFLLKFPIQFENFIVRKTIVSRWQKMKLPSHGPLPYEAQIDHLERIYLGMGNGKWVTTSGTRNLPKRIPYDKKRIFEINKVFLKSMITLGSHIPGLKTFFVFSSLESDNSLTASMVEEGSRPSHYELLQAPYRYLATPEGKKLRELTGDLAARTALILVTRPSVFYATNPSTISHFICELENHWSEAQSKIKLLLQDQVCLQGVLNLQDGNGAERLAQFTKIKAPDLKFVFAKLKAFITWQGGYVKSYLDLLNEKLPQVEQIPMYSMSTETIETLPHLMNNKIVFLPTMKGVRPEFMDSRGRLFAAHELSANETYTLIVTDIWGLQRYDTNDEFLVREMIDGLPDLVFKRRRNVTASLTGEKLTEEQVVLLIEELKTKFKELRSASLSLFPVIGNDKAGYQLAVINGEMLGDIATVADSFLGSINTEYASKVSSGRLESLRVIPLSMKELAELMNQEKHWESQFKVMPLYERPIKKNKWD